MGPPARGVAGGIVRLSALLAEYERQIEYDLAAHCGGQDLRDLWRPCGGPSRLTWRRLAVLVDGLPGESLTKTAIRDRIPDEELAEQANRAGDAHGPWSRLDLLIAALIDRVELLRRDTAAVHGVQPPGDFQPVRRPGVLAKRRIGAAQLAHLRKLREEHEALHGVDAGATVTPLSQEDRDLIAAQVASLKARTAEGA